MALKVFEAGETLFASDLNNNFAEVLSGVTDEAIVYAIALGG